jgi:hypothetical protein
MESTQNKLYEIEESAFVDQSLKNNIIDEDLIGEENKNGKYALLASSHLNFLDYDVYADQFDDGHSLGVKPRGGAGDSMHPSGG